MDAFHHVRVGPARCAAAQRGDAPGEAGSPATGGRGRGGGRSGRHAGCPMGTAVPGGAAAGEVGSPAARGRCGRWLRRSAGLPGLPALEGLSTGSEAGRTRRERRRHSVARRGHRPAGSGGGLCHGPFRIRPQGGRRVARGAAVGSSDAAHKVLPMPAWGREGAPPAPTAWDNGPGWQGCGARDAIVQGCRWNRAAIGAWNRGSMVFTRMVDIESWALGSAVSGLDSLPPSPSRETRC